MLVDIIFSNVYIDGELVPKDDIMFNMYVDKAAIQQIDELSERAGLTQNKSTIKNNITYTEL